MAKQQELSLNTGKLSGTCRQADVLLGYEYNEIEGPQAPRKVPLETVIETEKGELIEIIGRITGHLKPRRSPSCPSDQKMESLRLGRRKKMSSRKGAGYP